MRTLAAIMFTDIAGYTAIMQQDEQEALLVRQIHRKHFNALTAQYNGKILQYYGDGTLSIFNSVHQAVQCGIERKPSNIQQKFQYGSAFIWERSFSKRKISSETP